MKGRASVADQIEDLLSEIPPPAIADDFPLAAPETERRWPITVVALTCLVLVVTGWMVAAPHAGEDPVAVRTRIESDARTLAELVERYRVAARDYPDDATWRLSSQRGDSRFLDPWRRPYVYRLSPRAFTIASYGADQRRGGTGPNMDVELSFPRSSNDEVRAP